MSDAVLSIRRGRSEDLAVCRRIVNAGYHRAGTPGTNAHSLTRLPVQLDGEQVGGLLASGLLALACIGDAGVGLAAGSWLDEKKQVMRLGPVCMTGKGRGHAPQMLRWWLEHIARAHRAQRIIGVVSDPRLIRLYRRLGGTPLPDVAGAPMSECSGEQCYFERWLISPSPDSPPGASDAA